MHPLRISGQAIGMSTAEVTEPTRIAPGLVEGDVADRRATQIPVVHCYGSAFAGAPAELVELVDGYLRTRHRVRLAAADSRHHHQQRAARAIAGEIGRASCRDRVCQYV